MSEETPHAKLPHVPRPLMVALWVMAALAFLFFQWGTWCQYQDAQIRGDAVQVFNVMLSRFADGGGMIHVHSDNHFFKNHLMLWLYPVGWMYKLHDSLWTYLTPLNLALAIAIVPLGLLAWRRTQSMLISSCIAFFYALSSLTGSMRFSIHPESYLMPAWFLLFYGVEVRRLKWIITGFILAIMVKEDSGLWLAVFFAWTMIFQKLPRKTALIFLIIAGLVFVASRAIMNAIPLTGTTNAIGDFWLARYGSVANSPGELAFWMLTHPAIVIQRIVANGVWVYLLLTGGILCILGWRELLLLIPPAVLFFAASADEFHSALYYYVYPFIPPIFLALVSGCGFILGKSGGDPRALRAVTILLILLAAVQFAIPTRVDGWKQLRPRPSLAERVRINAIRSLISRNVPRDARIKAATHYELNQWIPRGRQLLFLRDRDLQEADIVLLDTHRVSADLGREKYLLLLEELQQPQRGWRVAEEVDGVVLLKKP
ncbi:DUF2079 domain-containing protein [Candidatus Sumerlaeota bacterium]|nr:DUF2079 domain-containing protein [Candidatus Sumerlaeota bacterium]